MRKLTLSERGRRAGKARLQAMTPEERQRVARLGAEARNKELTKEQRQEAARKAVLARWARTKRQGRGVP